MNEKVSETVKERGETAVVYEKCALLQSQKEIRDAEKRKEKIEEKQIEIAEGGKDYQSVLGKCKELKERKEDMELMRLRGDASEEEGIDERVLISITRMDEKTAIYNKFSLYQNQDAGKSEIEIIVEQTGEPQNCATVQQGMVIVKNGETYMDSINEARKRWMTDRGEVRTRRGLTQKLTTGRGGCQTEKKQRGMKNNDMKSRAEVDFKDSDGKLENIRKMATGKRCVHSVKLGYLNGRIARLDALTVNTKK